MQFNDDDHKAVRDFIGLLINIGFSSTEAYKEVDEIINKKGWSFAFYNDPEDFWILDNETK